MRQRRSARKSALPWLCGVGLCWCVAAAGERTKEASRPMDGTPQVKSKEVFLKAQGKRVTQWASTFYARGTGLDMVCNATTTRRSDTVDTWQRRYSTDNGRRWSDWETVSFVKRVKKGVHRLYAKPGWADPKTGRLLTLVLEATLPTDNPMEGMKHWALRYRVSTDGGKTDAVDEPVVQKGGDYTPQHPVDGVWVGKNSIMMGAAGMRPIRTRRGHILVPVQITPIGPNGEYYNPGGGLTYHDSAVLIGTWRDDLKIDWELSQRVVADPKKSTRGCLEATIIEAPDGRIAMVMRGSNDRNRKLPGHKWYSVSDDGGFHWSPIKPWTYADGTPFFSPSSCSQLLKHTNGRIYWIGNISPRNTHGNSPRYPLAIGQVDPTSLLLVKDTVAAIDTRQPGEDADLQLSNFLAYEDRESHDIVVHVTRFFHTKGWRGDAYVFRIVP